MATQSSLSDSEVITDILKRITLTRIRILSYRFWTFQFRPLISASVCGYLVSMTLVSINLKMITLLTIWMAGALWHLIGQPVGNSHFDQESELRLRAGDLT